MGHKPFVGRVINVAVIIVGGVRRNSLKEAWPSGDERLNVPPIVRY